MIRPRTFLLAVLGLILLTAGPIQAERGIRVIGDLIHDNQQVGSFRALIIGIDDYQDKKIPDLKTAVNDAKELAKILTLRYGFETKLLLNRSASRKAIYQALRDLVKSSKANDSVLIYYAGHGDLDRTYDDGWWIPADARGGDPVTYLDNGQVQKAMRSLKARHALLISDSCYSGTLFGETRALPKVIDEKYYLDLYNEKSRWGMTSGNKTPVADDGTNGHSIFAYQLLKELRQNRRPYLTTQELYTRIAPIISNNSEQTPLCRPMRNTGDMGGEFIFIASSGAVVDLPAPVEPKTLLSVKSNLRGAKVYLNDQLIGMTDFSGKEVSPGNYQVRVEMDGYRPYSTRVSIQKGRETSLQAFLDAVSSNGTLRVTATPASATIRILNIGPKFYQGITMTPGRYHVEVASAGYKTQRLWITLTSGESKELEISLNKISSGTDASTVPATGIVQGSAVKTTVPVLEPVPANLTSKISNSLGMELILIKPAVFMMGSPESEYERDADETQHRVTLPKGFYMGTTEVTVGQWRRFAEETQGKAGEGSQIDGLWNNPGFPQDEAHPVTSVSWTDVQQFVRWLSRRENRKYRLPTEAEWEYACRAGSTTSRFWGEDSSLACEYANGIDKANKSGFFGWAKKIKGSSYHKCNDGQRYTGPVASYKPNNFGLFDMTGNVWEWCQDIYGDYSEEKAPEPQEAADQISYRVVRGCGWESKPQYCRSADRLSYPSDTRYNGLGFRVVMDY